MANRPLHPLIHRLLCRAGRNANGGVDDGVLLEHFLRQKDEAAVETLVWRHGPMVLGTCRHLLRNGHDGASAGAVSGRARETEKVVVGGGASSLDGFRNLNRELITPSVLDVPRLVGELAFPCR